MKRIGVMQVTDTLAAGGLERVAVNLANHLPREQFDSHLCVTRQSGPLEKLLADHVKRLHLDRRARWNVKGVVRLAAYMRANDIRILHAHGTSLFISGLAAVFPPHPALVWHDHFGRSATEERPVWLYRMAARTVDAVITVNQTLRDWSEERLHLSSERVSCIPNFVCDPFDSTPMAGLPGEEGGRIVCVANLRPEKDHLNLLAAMRLVAGEFPRAHLLLVGKGDNAVHRERVLQAIREKALQSNVTWLGPQENVAAILCGCDVGVLSSVSEGAPLALIEYGLAGLPAIATNVGQCAEMLDQGRAGLLVLPKEPRLLADAMLALLRSPEKRAAFSKNFRERVRHEYSPQSVMQRVCQVYETVLDKKTE